MSTDKFAIQYDDEYDNLLIYSKARRSGHGIEWGDLDIAYDKNGKLANLEILNASRMLTQLTKENITKGLLKQVSRCTISTNEKAGILYISFRFEFKNKAHAPIEDTLTVKALNYRSPITA